MTNQAVDLDDYADSLQQVAESVNGDNVDFRARVPAGTVLGETQIEPGAKTVWTKRDSGQRIAGKSLPDRVPLWDLSAPNGVGQPSLVPPTIAVQRMNRNPGRFTTRQPSSYEDRVPIEATCRECTLSRGGVPRPFYDEYDLEMHRQILHPREFAIDERRREEANRREDRAVLRDVLQTIAPARAGRRKEEA